MIWFKALWLVEKLKLPIRKIKTRKLKFQGRVVAQLVERLLLVVEVQGSNPVISKIYKSFCQ